MTGARRLRYGDATLPIVVHWNGHVFDATCTIVLTHPLACGCGPATEYVTWKLTEQVTGQVVSRLSVGLRLDLTNYRDRGGWVRVIPVTPRDVRPPRGRQQVDQGPPKRMAI